MSAGAASLLSRVRVKVGGAPRAPVGGAYSHRLVAFVSTVKAPSESGCVCKHAQGLELRAGMEQQQEQAVVGLGLVRKRMCCLKRLFPGLKEGLDTVCSRVQSEEGLVNWRERGGQVGAKWIRVFGYCGSLLS